MSAPGELPAGELLAAYVATAERWHALRADARAANPVFDENARLAARLRASDEGLAAIATLLDHSASGVRVLAAAHVVDALPEAAIPVLQSLSEGDGLHAIAAAYALDEHRAGTLRIE